MRVTRHLIKTAEGKHNVKPSLENSKLGYFYIPKTDFYRKVWCYAYKIRNADENKLCL